MHKVLCFNLVMIRGLVADSHEFGYCLISIVFTFTPLRGFGLSEVIYSFPCFMLTIVTSGEMSGKRVENKILNSMLSLQWLLPLEMCNFRVRAGDLISFGIDICPFVYFFFSLGTGN